MHRRTHPALPAINAGLRLLTPRIDADRVLRNAMERHDIRIADDDHEFFADMRVLLG